MEQIKDLENMIENLRKNFTNMSRFDDKINELAKQIVIFIINFIYITIFNFHQVTFVLHFIERN